MWIKWVWCGQRLELKGYKKKGSKIMKISRLIDKPMSQTLLLLVNLEWWWLCFKKSCWRYVMLFILLCRTLDKLKWEVFGFFPFRQSCKSGGNFWLGMRNASVEHLECKLGPDSNNNRWCRKQGPSHTFQTGYAGLKFRMMAADIYVSEAIINLL